MKCKAVFLLVVFLFNTVVGFGCTFLDHGTHHHHHTEQHEHASAAVMVNSFSKADPCCKTLVNDLIIQSKLIPETGKVQVVLPVIWLPSYSYALLVPSTIVESGKPFYAHHRKRPPDKDIRVFIQSFQL